MVRTYLLRYLLPYVRLWATLPPANLYRTTVVCSILLRSTVVPRHSTQAGGAEGRGNRSALLTADTVLYVALEPFLNPRSSLSRGMGTTVGSNLWYVKGIGTYVGTVSTLSLPYTTYRCSSASA